MSPQIQNGRWRWWAWLSTIAIAVGLLAGWSQPASADETLLERLEEQKGFVVQVPRLGPMYVVGRDAEHAVGDYVEELIHRGVFNEVAPTELRAWGRVMALSAGRAPTLQALRATGRPIIGIQLNAMNDLNGPDVWMAHRAALASAVIQAGGVPLFLPPAPSSKQIHSELQQIDHLLLAGGADVSPELQPGVVPNPKFVTNVVVDRDEQDLIRRALDAGLGIHAICRGSQILQVTFGGRLIQDIPTSGLATLDHGSGQGNGKTSWHSIRFERGSEIGQALGSHLSVQGKHNHHQAVDPEHMAAGFRVVATSHDGIPEGIEGFNGRVIGVQVHPEAASKGSALRHAFFGPTLMEPSLERMAARDDSTTTALPLTSPRALTLALHSIVGEATERPTWNVWHSPPVPRVASTTLH